MHHLWNKSNCDKQFIHSIQCNHFQSCNSICSCRRHYNQYYCNSKRFVHSHKNISSATTSSSSRRSRNSSRSRITNDYDDNSSSLTLSQTRHHSVNTSHSERILCTRQQRIRRNRFKFMRSIFDIRASASALYNTNKYQYTLSTCRNQCNTSISWVERIVDFSLSLPKQISIPTIHAYT